MSVSQYRRHLKPLLLGVISINTVSLSQGKDIARLTAGVDSFIRKFGDQPSR
jgi:hypothetical protein